MIKILMENKITLLKKEKASHFKWWFIIMSLEIKFRDNLKKELELNGINVGIHYPLPITR